MTNSRRNPIRIVAACTLALPALLAAGCHTNAPTAGGGSTGGSTASGGGGTPPPLAKKAHYTVGFSQVVSNNPWRIAETNSMKAEAAKRGDKLIFTDATDSEAKQIADVTSMVAQHVDLIFLAPKSEKPLAQAVLKAKAANIPVILLDRRVDAAMARPGADYVTFIGSDFVDQGKRAGQWLVKATGGKAKIIELEGTAGSSPAIDRKKGFDDVVTGQPGMQIIASQPADFARDKGRQVTETLLQAHPDVTVVYAHNDEMALGAISALEAAGKKPGKDVLVVSIDGERDGLQAIADGKLNYDVQSSPFFGPVAFGALDSYAGGQKVPADIVVHDKAYDAANARQEIASSY